MKTGGQLIVDCLEAQGVERVFTVPGESYLAVLDALYDSAIENVVTRQEGGAAMMAEADGKMTGRPGVAIVTRGPGATNASAGVHIAKQDSTPMILLVGQIGRRMRGREAFQEVDYRAMFTGLAKWVEEIDHADRIPEVMSHAWHVAMSGRPGPVVLALPEDMLRDMADVAAGPRVEVADPAPAPADMAKFADLLGAAKSPLLVLGGSRWSRDAVDLAHKFAQETGLPVGTTFRRQNLFTSAHPNYAGDIGLGINPELKARVEGSDLLILLGARFSENASQGFSMLGIPEHHAKLVHIHPGAEELGRIYAPSLSINAAPGAFLQAAMDAGLRGADVPPEAHRSYLDWTRWAGDPAGVLTMGSVIAGLKARLADDGIVTNGAGNYAAWLHRYWQFKGYDTYLGATSGSMGYGLPAAVAAKLRYPDREVVCFAGDGCFQMTMQEFGTAVQSGAAVKVIVADNGVYGTIRMHQEREYAARVSGTDMVNPDFAALARSYGAVGIGVSDAGEVGAALDQALGAEGPALVHVKTAPHILAPGVTVDGLRKA